MKQLRIFFLMLIMLCGYLAAQEQKAVAEPDLFSKKNTISSFGPNSENPAVVISDFAKPVTVNLPVLGSFPFYPSSEGLVGRLASKATPLDLEELVIDDAVLTFTKNKGIRFEGHARFFDQGVRLSLKEFSQQRISLYETRARIHLGFQFDTKPVIEFIPGVPMTIDAADLILEQGHRIKLVAMTTIGNYPIQLNMIWVPRKNQRTGAVMFSITAGVQLPQMYLEELLPAYKGTVLGRLIVILRMTVNKITSPNPVIVLEGAGSFSDIPAFNFLGALNLSIVLSRTSQTITAYLANAQIRPFTRIPGLADVTFQASEITFDRADSKELTLRGELGVLGAMVNSSLTLAWPQKNVAGYKQASAANKDNVVVYAAADIGDFNKFPALHGAGFSAIKFTKGQVVIVSRDYTTNEGIPLQKGISFTGEIVFEGPLAALKSVAPTTPGVPVQFVLSLDPSDLAHSSLGFELPLGVQLSPTVSLGKIRVAIDGGLPLGIGLTTMVRIKPTPVDPDLLFTMHGALKPPIVELDGSFEGIWKNPFGIEGLTIKNVGLGLNFILSAPPVPTLFKLAGSLAFSCSSGTCKELLMAAAVPIPDLSKFGLYLQTKGRLGLEDLVDVARAVTKKEIDSKSLPEFYVEDVDIRLAPNTFTIGNLKFQRGILIAGIIKFWQAIAHIEIVGSSNGFIGIGYVDPIKLDPLLITGNGPTGGPELQMVLLSASSTVPFFKLNGQLVLEPFIKSLTDIMFTKNGAEFHLFNYYQIDPATKIGFSIDGKIPLPGVGKVGLVMSIPSTYLNIVFDNTMMDYLKKRIDTQLDTLELEINTQLSNRQTEVRELNKQIADIQKQIAAKQSLIAEIQPLLVKKKADSELAVDKAKGNADAKKADLEVIQKKIADLSAWWDPLPDKCWPWETCKTTRALDYGLRLGALKGYYQTAQVALMAASQALDRIARPLVILDPTQFPEIARIARLNLEIGSLKAKILTLSASRNIALHVLEGVKKVGSVIIVKGGKLATKLVTLVHLQHLSFEGYAKELTAGQLPHLTMVMNVGGKEVVLEDLTFDFKQPQDSAELFARKIKDFVKELLRL
jgi:hypothetical protein